MTLLAIGFSAEYFCCNITVLYHMRAKCCRAQHQHVAETALTKIFPDGCTQGSGNSWLGIAMSYYQHHASAGTHRITTLLICSAPRFVPSICGVMPLACASGNAVSRVRLNCVVKISPTSLYCSAVAKASARTWPSADKLGSAGLSAAFSA